MNSLKDNIHTALGIMQDRKVCVWALDRGTCSKSKQHSLPQADLTGNLSMHSLCIDMHR